ncbi:MAG TPA: hypothetical protein H9983_05925 [Candidatus Kurthia intestinigallinarum]|nr:hypothetical protein [Candidatus Kurthia intestinigallinarum]
MKVIYNDCDEKIVLGEIMTNHSLSVFEAIDILGIDLEEWRESLGWEDYDLNGFAFED